MAEVSSSHSSLTSQFSSGDGHSGSFSLPEPLPSSPHYTNRQLSQERLLSHSSSRQSSMERLPPSTPPSQSRQTSRELLPGSSSEYQRAHTIPGPSVASWSSKLHNKTINSTCSSATLENCRYKLKGEPQSDHENEDRHFTMYKNNTQIFGVFDGHDGSRAVGFASNYMMEFFDMDSWKKVVETGETGLGIESALREFIIDTDSAFFKSIARGIELKEVYTALIPPNMTSYQAHLNYPAEVAELQMLEPKINGGCTAVLAVIANQQLYVANVGDSRAVVIREKSDGTMCAEQLSVDHGVENEDELNRLEGLGLSRDNLKRAGRLGMHENTRSIGDYYIKKGYKDVDTLVSAREPPGIAIPHVATPVIIDQTLRYLVLMTDGVYKSIEGQFENEGSIDANKVLTSIIDKEDKPGSNPTFLADSVLARISKAHHKAYQTAAERDQRSTLAVNCRKRDDMTCVIYKFSPPTAAPRKRPLLTSQQSQSAPPSLVDSRSRLE